MVVLCGVRVGGRGGICVCLCGYFSSSFPCSNPCLFLGGHTLCVCVCVCMCVSVCDRGGVRAKADSSREIQSIRHDLQTGRVIPAYSLKIKIIIERSEFNLFVLQSGLRCYTNTLATE